jgi:hypothetical protein
MQLAEMKTEPKARRPNSPAKDAQGDFAQFTDFMRRLVAVPHSKIKETLEAEKASKRNAKAVSASHGSVV